MRMTRGTLIATWMVLLLVPMSASQGCSNTYTAYAVIDGSERITQPNFLIIKNAVKDFINHSITLNSDNKIGVVVYSTVVTDVISVSSNISTLHREIDVIAYPGYGTYTHLAINRTRQLLADSSDKRKVMIVITDGLSSQKNRTTQAAAEARRSGITMVTVRDGETLRLHASLWERSSAELNNIASSSRWLFQVENVKELSDKLLEISHLLCNSSGPHCPAHIYNTTEYSFLINQTTVGETFYTGDSCGVDGGPLGQIKCLEDAEGGAMWGNFTFHQTCNISQPDSAAQTISLKKLATVALSRPNIEDVLRKVINVTKETNLTHSDLLSIATILEKTTNLPEASARVVRGVMQIYNNVLKSDKAILLNSQEQLKVANRIIQTVDDITDKLRANPAGYQRFVTETLATEAWDLRKQNVTNLPIGLQLTDRSRDSTLRNTSLQSLLTSDVLDHSETDIAIVLPGNFVQDILSGTNTSNVSLSMNVFSDPRLFSVSHNYNDELSRRTLNSKIISAKILLDGQQVSDLNGAEVSIILKPIKILPAQYRNRSTVCVFWNFTGNSNRGSWSTDGCRYDRQEDGRDVCVCNHLTNFAILMDYYGQTSIYPDLTASLSFITIIGLGFSIFGLSVTVLSFVLFRKLRQSHPQQTLFNLALAELCSWIVFLAGINQTQSHVGCIVVAALLHYFILASFMWMLAEAVLYYRLLVNVIGTYTSKYMLKIGVPSWVLPLLPVIVVLAIDVDLYKGGETYCWMSLLPFYYGFVLPVGLVILTNIILYIRVVNSICSRSKARIQRNGYENESTLLSIRESVVCFVLLGLSWIFGFLAISDARVVFQYIFCITNSIQGFLIFIFFTARSKQVRESWRTLCCKERNLEATKRRPRYSVIRLYKRSSGHPSSSEDNTDVHTYS